MPQQVIQAALCAIVGGRLDFQKICLFFKGDKTAVKRCLGFYTDKTELEWISFNPQKLNCNSTSRLLHFEHIPVLPPFPLLPVLSTSSQRTPFALFRGLFLPLRGLPLPSSQRTPSALLSKDSLFLPLKGLPLPASQRGLPPSIRHAATPPSWFDKKDL